MCGVSPAPLKSLRFSLYQTPLARQKRANKSEQYQGVAGMTPNTRAGLSGHSGTMAYCLAFTHNIPPRRHGVVLSVALRCSGCNLLILQRMLGVVLYPHVSPSRGGGDHAGSTMARVAHAHLARAHPRLARAHPRLAHASPYLGTKSSGSCVIAHNP